MWEPLEHPETPKRVRLEVSSNEADALAAFIESAASQPWASRVAVVVAMGALFLTSRRRYEDAHVAAGTIGVGVTPDGEIALTYEPPHGVTPDKLVVATASKAALRVLSGMVERLLADHASPSPEEASTDTSKERPAYNVGDQVQVVLNARNRTPHQGTVRERIWHHKHGCWTYYLEEGGKKVSKRYVAEDLRAI